MRFYFFIIILISSFTIVSSNAHYHKKRAQLDAIKKKLKSEYEEKKAEAMTNMRKMMDDLN